MRLVFFVALCAAAQAQQPVGSRPFRLQDLRVPPGFQVSVYATVSGSPRHLAFGPNGVLYVAAMGSGSIVAIPEAGRTIIAARGLNRPHSLLFQGNHLLVSTSDSVVRFAEATTPNLVISAAAQRLFGLPTGGQHTTRTIGATPDGRILVAVGSSCNFCNESDRRRATVLQFNPDGGGEAPFAIGLRNTVSFAWHPVTGQLWATDHGGDNLGDNEPPDEINILEEGQDYGWPDCIGQQRGVQWGAQARPQRCAATAAPEWELQAHSAPLGIGFYTGNAFPAAFRNDALVAFHGSWNRSEPTGYKLVRVHAASGRATGVEDFLWGFLDTANRTRSGRPVHAISGPDGAVYVSDDATGNIYRIAWNGPRINDGGIARVIDNIYALYGTRLVQDAASLRVTANGLATGILYAAEGQINFAIPATLSGDIVIRVETGIAADEQLLRVEP